MTHDHPEATEAENGYDRLSRWYQSLERMLFGSALTRARYQLLDRLPQADRLLVFGDGDGRLTREISRRRPDCSMVSVDLSSEMLRLQRQRLSGGEEVMDPSNSFMRMCDPSIWTLRTLMGLS